MRHSPFNRFAVLATITSVLAAAQPAGGQAAQTSGQGAPNAEAVAEIRKRFLNDLDTLQAKFLALAEAFPAEKYAWRPGAGVRSVGEVFMHVASEYYVYTPLAYGAPRSPVIPRDQAAFETFEHNSSKDSVLKYLKDGFAYSKQSVGGLETAKLVGTQQIFGRSMTIIETTVIMTADLHEHLGQLIAYARTNGVKPPWTK